MLEKINTITENIPEVSGADKLTMRHDEALTEICILTRDALAGGGDETTRKEEEYYRKSLEKDALREIYAEEDALTRSGGKR